MKLSFSVLLLAAVSAIDYDERGDKGPNFCVKSNKLDQTSQVGGPNWKCKSRQKKNKGDSKKCKAKCPGGGTATCPKKVRCEENVGWMTKKQGIVNAAAVSASCCDAPTMTATCNFDAGDGANGAGTVTGSLTIQQLTNCGDGVDRVVFKGKLGGDEAFGFTAGLHGLHIHNGGDLTNSCADSGGHMAVTGNEVHGAPSDTPPDRHQGDLGNMRINAKGMGDVWVTDTVVSLDSGNANFIGGRAMVLHAGEDDPEAQPTGAAGARVGCCLITMN
jgi:Cu/Zn superoxide dismutase